MHFEPTDEQKMVRETVRQFAEERLRPTAHDRDKEQRPPLAEIKDFARMGFLGMTIPEEFGGAPLDDISEAIVIEELSRCDASAGVLVAVHCGLCSKTIVVWGTDAQKRKYLPRLASGEWIGAYSLSEPNSGSDAAALITKAERKGDKFILNGRKNWVTNGSIADLYILMARTGDATVSKAKGISAFIVEKTFPGFRVGKKEDKLGIRSSDTVELELENCEVPAENVLSAEGNGFKVALNALDISRIGIAAQAVGIAQGALDYALQYSKEREAFGQKVKDFQTIGNYLADMHTRTDAARLLTYRAADMKGRGVRHTIESSMAKLFAGDTAVYVADRAVQILGGYGYVTEFPVERAYRDAKITQIYEGTNEIQRIVIARNL
jgi:alkylation response protein AidB-like acyl-CoA dehydrogenase